MKGSKPDLIFIDDIAPVEWEKAIDPELGEVNVLEHENGMIMTNMEPGGWVETKNGSFVSVEYAQSLNRAQRRKEGIKL